MPPKVKITKDAIIAASLGIIRKNGTESLNARAIANALNCSTQPIFSNFPTMAEVKDNVIQAANELYHQFTHQKMQSSGYPPYKASGMAYIQFAKEERELFKLLFMRDRTGEEIKEDKTLMEEMTHLIASATGLSHQEAYLFHLEMWIYVHGIASMVATSYLEWDQELASKMLTDAYQGLIRLYQSQNTLSEESK